MANAKKICDIVKGTKIGLPGMDLVRTTSYSVMSILYLTYDRLVDCIS